MTMLIHVAGHPLLHALGWTLIHFCWQGLLTAGMLWCVLAMLDARSSEARYGAACFALVLMVAMPLMTFAHIASDDLRISSATWNSTIAIDAAMLLQVGAGDSRAPWPARMALALDHSMPWLLMAWLAGAIFFVVRLNFGLIVARRLKSLDTDAPQAELQRMFNRLRLQLGIERAVRLLHSARVQVPTVIGWLRPVVLIPASCLTGLCTEQIEAIFCHELAHVRRHDYLVSVFQSVAEALLFYHPAMWWVSKQVRRERECCCDEIAVSNGGDALAYAKALSYLEERRAAFPDFVLGANGGLLTMRIKRLLGCAEDAPSQFGALTLLVIVLTAMGSYAASIARAQAKVAGASVGEIAATTGQDDQRAGEAATARGRWTGVDIREIDYMGLNSITVSQIDVRFRHDAVELHPETAYDPSRIAHAVAVLKDMLLERGYPQATVTVETKAVPPAGVGVLFKINEGPRTTLVGAASSGRVAVPVSYSAVQGKSSPAQADGSIAGIIVDPTGALVPRADISAVSTDVSLTMAKTTDNYGNYSLSPLPPGRYNVEVSARGFNRLIQKNVQVVPGQPVNLNLRLSVGEVGQSLTVTGKPFAEALPPPPSQTFEAPANRPAGPMRISAGVSAGMAISQPAPVYPEDAKAAHIQGIVVLKAIISKAGTVENLTAISGPPQLIASAIDAVKQWRYKPYLLNGEPVEVQTTINVNYTFGPDPSPSATAQLKPAPNSPESDPGESGVRRVPSSKLEGNLISKVNPIYPAEAKAAGVQGPVILRATISKQGTIAGLQLISGPAELTSSAWDAVKQWTYKPYLLNGEPIEVQTTITVNFTLGESDDSAQSRPQVATNHPAKMADGATAPVVIYQVPPEYTREARKAKTSGVVLVNLKVDQQGRPQDVHVVRGIGNGLDKRAVEAVKRYRFKPAMKDDKPVEEALNVEINFQIF